MAEAAMLIGPAISAIGQIREGEAANSAAQYNAQVAEQNAQTTLAQSAEEERRLRVMARKQIGDARANYGASGVSLEGSPLDVLEESAATAELDALTVRYGGQQKAQAYRNEAKLERFRGKNSKTSGYLSAAGTLFQAGGKAAASGAGGGSGGGGGSSGGGAKD